MKRLLLTSLFLSVIFRASAQLGISVAPTFSAVPDWQVVVENYVVRRHTEFLHYGTMGTLDYELPLKWKSVKFLPAFQAMRATVTYHPYHFEVYSLGIQGNVNIQPFVSEGKEKPGPFSKFALQISPGLAFVHKIYDQPVGGKEGFTGQYIRHEDRSFDFNIGCTAMLNLQLSDFLAVAPFVGMRFYPNVEWEGFTETVSEGKMSGTFDRTDWRQFFVGIRMEILLKKNPPKTTDTTSASTSGQ